MDKKDLIFFGVLEGIGAIIGALAGLGLSCFPALPVLAAGAIIAAIPTILFCACMVYDRYSSNQLSKDDIIMPLILSSIGAAIGVGLAAVAGPGVMLELYSAAGLGAGIGAIAPIAAFAGLFAILSMVEKVSKWVESPKVEPATPSKKNEEAAASLPMK